jgi:hypothetical protein
VAGTDSYRLLSGEWSSFGHVYTNKRGSFFSSVTEMWSRSCRNHATHGNTYSIAYSVLKVVIACRIFIACFVVVTLKAAPLLRVLSQRRDA